MSELSPDHGTFKNFAAKTSTLLVALETLLELKQPKTWSSDWLIKTDRRLADGLRARFAYDPTKATDENPYLLDKIDIKWHASYAFGKDGT